MIDGVKGDMIEGVTIVRPRWICDERGRIMHMLKSTDEHFTAFGELYFSCAYPDVVKAWHIHSRMTLNNCCLSGMIKLVLYDDRPASPTRGNLTEIFMGEDNYLLAQIPPGITNGYKPFGDKMAILANCPDMAHNPDEMSYVDPFGDDVPYDWALKNG